MAALSGWPSVSDDSGTGQDGTVFNEAFFTAIKDSIEGELVSATNPSEVVADIIDEIVDARGSKTSLDARLDVALNEDGTLKTQASLATLSQLQQQIGAVNLQMNDDFVIWAAGDAVAPTGWALSTITCARAGTGLGDTNRKIGDFCVKLTRAGADGYLYHYLADTSEIGGRADFFKNMKVSIGAWVKCSTPNVARVGIGDGATTTYSSYHTGGGDWEWLSVTHTISNSATSLASLLGMHNTAADAYFSGVTVVMSDEEPSQWQPCPKVYGTIVFRVAGTLATGDGQDNYAFQRPAIVKEVALLAATAPTGQALICDVDQYDTSAWQAMFSTRPQVAAGANVGHAEPDGTYAYRCFSGGDASGASYERIRLNIDQVGSGTAGADLWAWVRCMQYARPLESILDADHYSVGS